MRLNPKLDNEVTEFIERFAVEVEASLDEASLRRLIHDLNAAATAFILMVEEYEYQLGSNPNELMRLKLHQLKQHARRNQSAIEKITTSLRKQFQL